MIQETIPACNHTSAGVIVRQHDRLLLLERKKFPVGFACPAGHYDFFKVAGII